MKIAVINDMGVQYILFIFFLMKKQTKFVRG
jgi:hypothetical protein